MWVVYFHNVLPGPLDSFDNRLSRLSLEAFEREIAFFARHFRFVSMAELLERHAAGEEDRRALAVTFDDGYRGVLDHAAPVLEAAGAPATLFVVTDPLTQGDVTSRRLFHFEEIELAFRHTEAPWLELDWLEEPLSLTGVEQRVAAMKAVKALLKVMPEDDRRRCHAELLDRLGVDAKAGHDAAHGERWAVIDPAGYQRLLAAGWTLGGHTRSHRTLAALGRDDLESEIAGSRTDLAQCLGLDGDDLPFAYPYGRPEHVGDAAPRAVRDAGFACAFTTEPARLDPGSDRYRLPRLEAHELRWALEHRAHAF